MWCITHRNVLANIIPVEREVAKYRDTRDRFFPIRFLNLLPLSHMFGQAMATFMPPMLPGTVVFTRSFNPDDIVSQIRTRRISVLVCVPKMLEVLREHIRSGRAGKRRPATARHALGVALVALPPRAQPVRLKFWAFVVGAAPLDPELEAFWGASGSSSSRATG